MEDLFVLQTLEQVKALTDPLRQRILGEFLRQPMTTKQVAQQLGEQSNRLYHHVAILEQAGLVQIVETRQNRGTIEKYYRAVASKFHVDRNLFEFAPESAMADSGVQLIVTALEVTLFQLQDTRAQTLLGTQLAPENLVFTRALGLRVTPDQIAALRARIETWLEECGCGCEDGATTQDAEGPLYALTLILYPTFEADDKSN